MKMLNLYQTRANHPTIDTMFQNFLDTLCPSITGWKDLVNWLKVGQNHKRIEQQLHAMNYLVGKANIKEVALEFFGSYPHLMETIPILLAVRDDKFADMVSEWQQNIISKSDINMPDLTPQQACDILEEAGLLQQISQNKIQSFPSYVFGVEVGLDSNGRKNRTGTTMEAIVEDYIKKLRPKCRFDYLPQATSRDIDKEWPRHKGRLRVDHTNKTIDFVLNLGEKLMLIETNFYHSGGSKLKATAGEYKEVFQEWTNQGHIFLWVTDGHGWLTAKEDLRGAFEKLDYILNLSMLEQGGLDEVITRYQG